jgi:hypothetical protein
MWDLAERPESVAPESLYNSGKAIALASHSPGMLHTGRYKGAPHGKGKTRDWLYER